MSLPENAVLAKHCIALKSEDKRKRKHALEELRAAMFEENADNTVDEKILQAFKHVLRCFSDKTESCRETAISVFIDIIQYLPQEADNDQYFSYIVPVLLQRLGSEEIIEHSEEVRLALVSFIHIMVKKFEGRLASYISDLIQILIRTLVDPYPKIKHESCDCVSDIAKTMPRHFYTLSESLIKPILQSFSHQHSKVRHAAVKAIGNVVCYGNNKSVENVIIPLAERTFDQSPIVRQAVTQVIGMWLLELPDRYSFFHRMIPLILTSHSDTLPELRQEGWSLWEKAGGQYANENENDLKEEMDYVKDSPSHYPPGVVRPNLGCRTLIRRNLCKIVPALVHELDDWLVDVRIRSSQLACYVILNAEKDVTHHLERLLPGIYRASNDEDSRVIENIERAAELLGYFVSPRTYCKLVIPTIEDTVSSGHVRVFAGILRGSPRKKLKDKLVEIADFLKKPEMCQSKKSRYQLQLVNCCNALMEVSQEDCEEISDQLFRILLTVLGLATDNSVLEKSKDSLTKLQNVCGLASLTDLFKNHVRGVLEDLQTTAESWTLCTPERFIFEAILLHSGEVIGYHLDIVLPILVSVLNPKSDPEMKLKVFTILSTIMCDPETLKLSSDTGAYMITFIKDALTPNLVWHAGRTAEAIRTAAISCLCIILQNPPASVNNPDFLESISADMIPLLVALVDDSATKTRLFSLRTMGYFVKLLRNHDLLTREHLLKLYDVIVKRLDDVNDEVRLTSVKTIRTLFETVPSDFDPSLSEAPLLALFERMLTHLDDFDPKFQAVMLDALKDVGHVHPSLLHRKIRQTKHVYRNVSGCEELLAYLDGVMQDMADVAGVTITEVE